jgi:hypothetical protein
MALAASTVSLPLAAAAPTPVSQGSRTTKPWGSSPVVGSADSRIVDSCTSVPAVTRVEASRRVEPVAACTSFSALWKPSF